MISSPSARDFARFLEQPEGKAGRDAKADVAVAPAARRRAAVRGDLRRARADLQEEAALVGGLPGAKILDLDRVRGNALLVVVDLDLDQVRAADLGARRQPPHDRQVAQAELAQHARDDDQRQQHAEQQIEQVVAGVDRGEADAERDADEVLALARELELARPEPANQPRAQRARRCGLAAGRRWT